MSKLKKVFLHLQSNNSSLFLFCTSESGILNERQTRISSVLRRATVYWRFSSPLNNVNSAQLIGGTKRPINIQSNVYKRGFLSRINGQCLGTGCSSGRRHPANGPRLHKNPERIPNGLFASSQCAAEWESGRFVVSWMLMRWMSSSLYGT